MDDTRPSAMQDSVETPMAEKRLINAYSRKPIPLRLTGIIEMRVMTGTKIRKYENGICRFSPTAVIQTTEIARDWFKKEISSDASKINLFLPMMCNTLEILSIFSANLDMCKKRRRLVAFIRNLGVKRQIFPRMNAAEVPQTIISTATPGMETG